MPYAAKNKIIPGWAVNYWDLDSGLNLEFELRLVNELFLYPTNGSSFSVSEKSGVIKKIQKMRNLRYVIQNILE